MLGLMSKAGETPALPVKATAARQLTSCFYGEAERPWCLGGEVFILVFHHD